MKHKTSPVYVLMRSSLRKRDDVDCMVCGAGATDLVVLLRAARTFFLWLCPDCAAEIDSKGYVLWVRGDELGEYHERSMEVATIRGGVCRGQSRAAPRPSN